MLSRTLTTKTLPFIFNVVDLIAVNPCQPPLKALFSTHIVGDKPVLVRDFIHSALYHPKHGYFSQRSRSVGVLDAAIKFNQLQGRKAYMKHVDKIYKQSEISWFTPVELFKPWYAHGIAEAIMRTANLSVPLKIYEIGGGSGTCAKGVMDYIMLNAPERVYNNMTYISVEISPSLAEIQKETVGQVSSHSSKFRVECRDAADRAGWENQVSPWMEVWVEKQHDRETLTELYKPLEDPLITRCIEIMEFDENHNTQRSGMLKNIWSKVFPKPRRCWLPTGCLKLLEVLHDALPKMSLIASDFTFLPDVKKDGSSTDYGNYLDAKGDADIFFPTDFLLLERMDHYCSGWLKMQKDKSSKQGKKRRTLTLDTSSFMEEFGLPTKTRTKDGYNPLLDDFKNTKFYLSVPTHNTK
ncbi:protein arginine methyltransferase NDUFAF7 [Citrus sinensis]|uniref:Protein arginine methyltransferase NDUFAF7 n=1 Tax=Citrus sinensis TaxID=2711 RepID=A0ACB8I164_CITSI|nr:protein arginine methyltransferase NDUFAF7 [Citrus sinensis]